MYLPDAERTDQPETDGSLFAYDIGTIESLLVTLHARLRPWFSIEPETISWVLSRRAPRSNLTTYWMQEMADILREDLQHYGLEQPGLLPPPYLAETDSPLPYEWETVLRSAVMWDYASSNKMNICEDSMLPKSVSGALYSSFDNPFLPLVDVWLQGAIIDFDIDGQVPTGSVVYLRV